PARPRPLKRPERRPPPSAAAPRRNAARPAAAALAAFLTLAIPHPAASAPQPLRESLAASPFNIACECYLDDNWDILVMHADGSDPVNLTRTPKEHEHYPQVSPDGTKLCYSVDAGQDRNTVRSLWVMDIDGRNRRKLADGAREPFWGPDSQTIGFLPQEYPRFSVTDYATRGMTFCDLRTGQLTPHPNTSRLHHLYNPSFAPNGKWIVATVHAGMSCDHAILAIEARGPRIVNLNIPGCRPCISPDSRQIAWGSGDHELVLAPISLESAAPAVGPWRRRIQHKTEKVYHVDWSPDSRFVCLSRGPASKGDPTKPGTFVGPCEMVGVVAPGWDLWAVNATGDGIVNLDCALDTDAHRLTNDGHSNKEPDWFKPPARRLR
ncbi:MAG: PD40 domain-containing protein, partial [Verrucomicrobia bacterium]|nr:PD40 domain-containing protein [Verrucomicrobiota bacterium]